MLSLRNEQHNELVQKHLFDYVVASGTESNLNVPWYVGGCRGIPVDSVLRWGSLAISQGIFLISMRTLGH